MFKMAQKKEPEERFFFSSSAYCKFDIWGDKTTTKIRLK